MPYLLLMGALFVLTLGMNLRADDDTDLIAENTIEYQQPDKQEFKAENCCHFHQSDENITTIHPGAIAASIGNSDFLIYQPRGKTIFSLVHHNYSFETHHTYCGLSPPALIS
ncbi:hypothetical protein [Sunxiuqinia sp. sy24]|uniref:hypothetical protein n=1 Tax=Sunxiuqinia sp. sy24 TaxID=3461495 RepID=UPI0040454C3A